MQISKTAFARLLRSDMPSDTLLLHGTNAEAARILFETGRLPTGIGGDYLCFTGIEQRIDDTWIGDKFFSGYFRSLHKHLLRPPKPYELAQAKGYAEASAGLWYINSVLNSSSILRRLGIPSKYAHEIALWYRLDFNLPEEISTAKFEVKLKRALEVISKDADLRKRGGVVLGLGRNVLEFPHEKFTEDMCSDGLTLRLDCPDGLDFEYVNWIRPVKQDDAQAIMNFLQK